MRGSWKRIGMLAAAAALVAAVATTAASARTDSTNGVAARSASTLNIMGFGTNGDDVAKSRFAIAQQAIAPDTVSAPNGGFNDQQFLAAVASGNPPDLAYMDRAKVGTYAADGALQPLTSCIKSQHINLKQYRPAALSQVTYKGKVYGIPEFFDVRTIISDYDVMKSSGVTLKMMNTAHPATLRKAALKMYQHSGSKVTRIGFDPKLPEFFPLWAKVFGVDILSKDGLHPHLNSPGAIRALTFAYGLIKAQGGYNAFISFRNTWDFFGADNQVAKDQVGGWPMEDWYVNVLAGSSPQVHTLLIPMRTLKGKPINYTSGSAWAIPKHAKNFTAACKWAKTMTATSTWIAAAKNRIALYKTKTPKGIFTGLRTANAVADRAIVKLYTSINPWFDQNVKTLYGVMPYSFSIPASPASGEFQTAWMNAVTRVLQGQQSPKAALNQAQKEAIKAIKAATK
jgi:multiple sugar transport system substrate-binding protein